MVDEIRELNSEGLREWFVHPVTRAAIRAFSEVLSGIFVERRRLGARGVCVVRVTRMSAAEASNSCRAYAEVDS